MKKLSMPALAVLIITAAHADEVDVPNQFQSGTPAVAAEVNANFAAIESAVDDNAQRVTSLEGGLGLAGVNVRVGGTLVGRYMGIFTGSETVDVSGGLGSASVAEGGSLGSALAIMVLSPTGYRFSIATSDFNNPVLLSEGELDEVGLFYDGAACTGNVYLPVEGDTGWFSLFIPGDGRGRPMTRWAARQGLAFQSPDPADPTAAYMLRRGAVPAISSLVSLKVFSRPMGQADCFTLAAIPGFDVNDPLHVDNWVVPVEALDPTETGISGILGGEITIGL